MKINICMSMDNNYAMQAGVTIFSIKQNRSTNIYDIYVLCKDVTDINKKKISELSDSKFRIHFIDIDWDYSKYDRPNLKANYVSMYKFFIPNILKDLDKVLYIDVDIVINKDLTDLYNTNIDNYYLAGIKDSIALTKKMNLNTFKYINGGVLLMNLKLLRKDSMPDKLLDYKKNGYNFYIDQDAINYVLKDKILILPFIYNTQINALADCSMNLKQYSIDKINKYWNINNNLEQIVDDAVIIHYTGQKPWKYYDIYKGDIWINYYYKSPFKNVKLNRKSFYLNKITKSRTYKISKIMVYPYIFIKNIIKDKTDRKYCLFLKKFN